MKIPYHILSNKSILGVTAILLTIAAALAFVGVGMQVQDPQEFVSTISAASHNQVTLYVMSGVMGEIPSVAGTLQSLALAIAYGFTPLVVISMFAAKTFIGSQKVEDCIGT